MHSQFFFFLSLLDHWWSTLKSGEKMWILQDRERERGQTKKKESSIKMTLEFKYIRVAKKVLKWIFFSFGVNIEKFIYRI